MVGKIVVPLQQISKRNEDEEFCIDFDVAPDGVLHEGRRGEGADYDTKDVYHYRRTGTSCDARRQSSNKDACREIAAGSRHRDAEQQRRL